MPELSRFEGIIIRMFGRDHNPPHFHAFIGEYEATFSIETGQMITGELPQKKAVLVNAWAILHQTELLNNWNALTSGEKVSQINPLSK